jgi:hypothetical protein
MVPDRLPSINEWCAYVTLAPDDSKMTVFNNGISNGSNAAMPAGGHALPSSTVGAKAEWKSVLKLTAGYRLASGWLATSYRLASN